MKPANLILSAILLLILTGCKRTLLQGEEMPSTQMSIPSSAGGIAGTYYQWEKIYEDNFDGTALDESNWSIYDNAYLNKDSAMRRRAAVKVGGGLLNLLVDRNPNEPGRYMTGGISNKTKLLYGKFEAKIRVDNDTSTSAVMLTWPDYNEDWPEKMENDIYETGEQRTNFKTYIHYGESVTTNGVERHQRYDKTHNFDPTQWHVVAMEWTPEFIKIYVDNNLQWIVTDKAAIARTPHHLCLQTEYNLAKVFTQQVRMQVDYVKLYKLKDPINEGNMIVDTNWSFMHQNIANNITEPSIKNFNGNLYISNVAYVNEEKTLNVNSNFLAYQAIDVVQGNKYLVNARVDADITVKNAWVELYMGDVAPQVNRDYSSNMFYGLDTYRGCLRIPVYGGEMLALSCNNTGSGTQTQGIYTATRTGKVYVVVKAGSAAGNIDFVTLSNIKVIPAPKQNLINNNGWQNILQSAASWRTINSTISTNNNVITYSNGTTSGQINNAVFQPVTVVAGKKYKVSLYMNVSGKINNSWVELYLGRSVPLPDGNYSDNKFYGMNWQCLSSPMEGYMEKLECNGNSIDGIFTATSTGTIYIVLKIGSWGGNIENLSIKNIRFQEL